MIRAVVVDDEPLARDGIRMMLAAHPDLTVVGEAGNGAEALALVARVRPDLLFVDVQMPEMSGLELAAALPAEGGPAVVFVTAYDEYAVRAFDVHALDYVLKPIDEARLGEAIRRARAHHELGDRLRGALSAIRTPPAAPPAPPSPPAPALPVVDRLAIRDGERVVFVRVDEIDWIEAADYYVEIHAGPRSYLHRETMQRLESLLDPSRFVRIHRSRLVNVDRIRELRWEGRGEMVVVTTEGVALKVSRSCRAKLQRLRSP